MADRMGGFETVAVIGAGTRALRTPGSMAECPASGATAQEGVRPGPAQPIGGDDRTDHVVAALRDGSGDVADPVEQCVVRQKDAAQDQSFDGRGWLTSFMQDDPGYIDLEQKTSQTIDKPFGARVSPMS